MKRAFSPAPWGAIISMILLATVITGLLGGYSFSFPGRDDYVSFSFSEWALYLAVIASIAMCTPKLRTADLGRKRARLASLCHVIVVVFLAAVGAGLASLAISARRAHIAATHLTAYVPPGNEYMIVSTLSIAGIALVFITLCGSLLGSMITCVIMAVLVGLHMIVPEGFPMPLPSMPFVGHWWQPVALAESLVLLSIGLCVWGYFGGARMHVAIGDAEQ